MPYTQRDTTRRLWDAILQEFAEQRPPMTVRQMYYRMSARGAVPKTEPGYRKTQRALAEMRRQGVIPYSHIADLTRWVRRPTSYTSLQSALDFWAQAYRRQLWTEQPAHVEIWLEKEALAGVIMDVTTRYDVPLYITKGYPSMTYLHDAAEALAEISKPIFIYHLGDYDASGQDAARVIREGLARFGASFTFVQAAVTPAQILGMSLQTRPSKTTDPRAHRHGAEAVELDAIPPAQLRVLVNDVIEQHIDRPTLQRALAVQEAERGVMQDLAAIWGKNA